ncbi:MAG: hypothetical protein ABIU77_16420 [Ferruginibacter sp.]
MTRYREEKDGTLMKRIKLINADFIVSLNQRLLNDADKKMGNDLWWFVPHFLSVKISPNPCHPCSNIRIYPQSLEKDGTLMTRIKLINADFIASLNQRPQ